MKAPRLAALGALSLLISASSPLTTTAVAKPSTNPNAERPWEVIADNGDMVLPNLFYSERSENEQIMSLKVGKKGAERLMIDHLIYPTIGNPKLYVRDDASDSVLTVLRLEKKYLTPFHPVVGTTPVHNRNILPLTLTPDNPGDGLNFYLIPRAVRTEHYDPSGQRFTVDGIAGPIPIKPSLLAVHPHTGVPAEFRDRETIRAYFDRKSLVTPDGKPIPAGLYDIRMEIRQVGAVEAHDVSYNAVQIFDHGPGKDFTVLSFSDTQINTGWLFKKPAVPHLHELVDYLTTTTDATVQKASFITFNGDLHDGGAVLQRYPRAVGEEYQKEADVILDDLKRLTKPVFLTSGNHDGYVSMGHVPPAIDAVTRLTDEAKAQPKTDEHKIRAAIAKKLRKTEDRDLKALDPIETVVREQYEAGTTWPAASADDLVNQFESYVSATKGEKEGGRHLDIFRGSHVRTVGDTFATSWHQVGVGANGQVDVGVRNMVFYDGQYQWQKTYGPLYYGYSFGSNYYITLNSYELRQHWRSGWGMYTVNYGGGMSPVQFDWFSRELKRKADRDVTVFAHHDPRGGHNGKDYPYYFGYVDYGAQMASKDGAATDVLRPDYFTRTSSTFLGKVKTDRDALENAALNGLDEIAQSVSGDSGYAYSSINYLVSENLEKMLCKGAKPADEDVAELGCMHDGLQEWMDHDKDYDCQDGFKHGDLRAGSVTCDPHHAWYSGYELITLIANSPNVRTMVLGHTHFNSIDELQEGDAIIPNAVTLGVNTLAELEKSGPMRARLGAEQEANDRAKLDVQKIYPGIQRFLQGDGKSGARELVIVRVTTAANLTSQYVAPGAGKPNEAMYGFQALTFEPSWDSVTRLGKLDFYRNLHDGKSGFSWVNDYNISRLPNTRLSSANGMGTSENQEMVARNPLRLMFWLGKKGVSDPAESSLMKTNPFFWEKQYWEHQKN